MGFGAALAAAGISKALDTGLSIYNTNSANKHAKRRAEQQRAWEEKMSNTAHQREIADLRAAGVNPLLTATGGNGAATPNSAAAQTFAAQVNGNDLSNAVIGGMNSATKKKEQEQGERLIESTIGKNQADISNNTRDSLEYQKTQQAQRDLLKAEEDESRSRTMLNNNDWNVNSATAVSKVAAINATNKYETDTAASRTEATNAENKKNMGDAEFQDSTLYRLNQTAANTAESYASAFRDVGVGLAAARGIPGNYSKTTYHYDGKGRQTGYSEERSRKY